MSDVKIARTDPPHVIHSSDGGITLTVPIRIKRRGKCKNITLPDGVQNIQNKPPPPIQQALARGHKWLGMLESGEVASLTELAAREGMDRAYVSRMINLTTLAPDIVEAILNEALPTEVALMDLASGTSLQWNEQRAVLRV